MNGKSIVNKHSFIALRDVFKINFDLSLVFEKGLFEVIFQH